MLRAPGAALAALTALTVSSVLALEWNTWRHRDLFAELEEARAHAAELDAQHRETQLEWSTLSEPARVRAMARTHLGLAAPSAGQIDVIALPPLAFIR